MEYDTLTDQLNNTITSGISKGTDWNAMPGGLDKVSESARISLGNWFGQCMDMPITLSRKLETSKTSFRVKLTRHCNRRYTRICLASKSTLHQISRQY